MNLSDIKPEPISSQEAYRIASSWGSYMRDGDPGAVFYTFGMDKAIVQDEAHRAALIAYTKDCFDASYAKDFKDGKYTEEHASERAELAALRAYFESATILTGLDEFTEAYITAALWSSTEDDGEPLDTAHSVTDIAPETLAKMVADCAKFQADNGEIIRDEFLTTAKDSTKQAGHDFWLTRNGHGAGFCDGNWEDEIGTRLDKAANSYSEFNLYVGDDGKIYA